MLWNWNNELLAVNFSHPYSQVDDKDKEIKKETEMSADAKKEDTPRDKIVKDGQLQVQKVFENY